MANNLKLNRKTAPVTKYLKIETNKINPENQGAVKRIRSLPHLEEKNHEILAQFARLRSAGQSLNQAERVNVWTFIENFNLAVSNSIRGAVINWAKTLSNEAAQYGITVNNILPGYTKTARLEELNKISAERTGRTIKQVEDAIIAQVPAGRFGRPDEIASVVAFFATESASFVTGTSLAVDGGWSKYS